MAFDFEAFLKNNKSKGLTSEEWLALSRYAADCPEGAIVEIGSFRGNSAIALGHGATKWPERSGARIFCVEPHEPFTGIYGGKFGPQDRGEFYQKMLDTGFFDRIALINLSSAEAAAGWNRPVGFLFIDGDHSPEGVRRDAELWLPHLIAGGIVAFDDAKDPAAGPLHVVENLTRSGNYRFVEEVGKIIFLRKGEQLSAQEPSLHALASPTETRALPVDQLTELVAGDDHYRAYVGQPSRYDFMAGSQFGLLFANGLRDWHRVLDFGCGSLRLGRLLIPYLREERYFGVEPNTWLIEQAIEREIGRDILRIKRPHFSSSDQFDCASFGTSFDFIVAQSIVTHTGPALFDRIMKNFAAVLEPSGLLLFSYLRAKAPDRPLPGEGWHYPGGAGYSESKYTNSSTKPAFRALP